MAKEYPCELCHKRPKVRDKLGKTAACQQCLDELFKQQAATTPKTAQKTKKQPFPAGSNEALIYAFLFNYGTAATISVIAKKLHLTGTVVTGILRTTLKKYATPVGKRFKLKTKYLRDDVNKAICAILTGADILPQLERLM